MHDILTGRKFRGNVGKTEKKGGAKICLVQEKIYSTTTKCNACCCSHVVMQIETCRTVTLFFFGPDWVLYRAVT
jgi:hypothetical protein